MVRAELSVEGLVDGVKIAGFPWTKSIECSNVRVFTNRITNTASYADILSGIIPSGSATVRFLLLTVDADSLIAWNDTVTTPAYPITLPAQHLFGIFNADETYATTGNPLLQFKANTNPTNLFLAVGLA